MILVTRVGALVLLAFAPPFGPIEPHVGTATTSSPLVVAIVLAGALLLRRRAKRAAQLLLVTLAAATVCALLFSGDHGPNARGVFVVAPLLWSSIVLGIRPTHSGAARRASRPGVYALGGAFVALSLLVAAWPRLHSRAAMWSHAADDDARNEEAAIRQPSMERLLRCARAASGCACARRAAAALLDANRFDETVRAIESDSAPCRADPDVAAARVGALLGLEQPRAASEAADAPLVANPTHDGLLLAKATALLRLGERDAAIAFARRAVGGPRTADARLLIANALVEKQDYDGAEAELTAVVKVEPKHAGSRYNLGVLAERRGRYRDAREAYLAALAIDPGYLAARYNLVLLTHRNGAVEEARHHLAKLTELAPRDPRIAQLRALVGSP